MKNYTRLVSTITIFLGVAVFLVPAVVNAADPISGLFTFISPAGGEKIVVGKTYDIQWKGPIKWIVSPRVIEYISDVKLILSCGDPLLGATNDTVIVKSTDNDGLYKWSVPKKMGLSDYCRIIIQDKKGKYYDVSPFFGIGMTPPPTLNVSCSVSPNPSTTNQAVTFASSVSGGTGSYSYSWSGACTGSSANCSNFFPTLGSYNALLAVISGSQSKSAICSVNVIAPIPSGTLTISKDSSSPVADIVIGNSTITLGVFRLAANNAENLDVDEINLSVTGGNAVNVYYLYNGTTLLGTIAGGTSPKFILSDGNLVIPSNSYIRVTVKAALMPVDGAVVQNGDIITASISTTDAVKAIGSSSGTQITSGIQTATASTMTIVKAKPVVTLAPGSPSGVLFPSTSEQLAIFNVSNQGADDVTFSSSESNLFVVQIFRSQNSNDGIPGNYVLKDESGTTLSTISVADSASSVTFTFVASQFTVAPGETRKLYVYGDTHEYTTQYDSIQLWLSDSADANISYSINSGTTIPAGTKIFRGNIYAGTLVRP